MNNEQKIIGLKLKRKLELICNNHDFTLGIMVNAKEEHWCELLEIITTEELDADRISLIALALGEI